MKKLSLPPPLPLLCGAVASLFSVSLPLTLLIVVFGELHCPVAALNGVLVISLLAVGVFFFLELLLRRRFPENAFALSYFAFFLLWGSIAFFSLLGSDLTYVFDTSAEVTRAVLYGGFSRLLIVHALALLFRIGREVVRYVRSLRH